MAVSRAFMYFIRQRHLLSYSKPVVISNNIVRFPFSTSQHIYLSKQFLTKVSKDESNNKVQVGFVEVAKDKTKLALRFILFGIGISGVVVLFILIFKELFSQDSPNYVYSMTFDRVRRDSRIIETFGEPIKAYGEETSRGRRAHVRNITYEKNGVQHMKMKFYIKGIHNKGSVHLTVKKDSNGNWMYRYLFIQLQNRPKSVIVLEDNRDVENNVYNTPRDSEELMPNFISDKMIK